MKRIKLIPVKKKKPETIQDTSHYDEYEKYQEAVRKKFGKNSDELDPVTISKFKENYFLNKKLEIMKDKDFSKFLADMEDYYGRGIGHITDEEVEEYKKIHEKLYTLDEITMLRIAARYHNYPMNNNLQNVSYQEGINIFFRDSTIDEMELKCFKYIWDKEHEMKK